MTENRFNSEDCRPSTYADRDVPCPHCAYNLRGVGSPRCPECGYAFSWEDYETGVLRETVPQRIDSADLFQPHQVILSSLRDLAGCIFRPGEMWVTLDVTGPAKAAVAAFLVNMTAVYAVCAFALAALIAFRSGVSPATAICTGWLYGTPRIVVVSAAVAIGWSLVCAGWFSRNIRQPSVYAIGRLLAFSVPVVTMHCVVVYVAILSVSYLIGMVPPVGIFFLGCAFTVVWSIKTAPRPSIRWKASNLELDAKRQWLTIGLAGIFMSLLVVGAIDAFPADFVELPPSEPLWIFR